MRLRQKAKRNGEKEVVITVSTRTVKNNEGSQEIEMLIEGA